MCCSDDGLYYRERRSITVGALVQERSLSERHSFGAVNQWPVIFTSLGLRDFPLRDSPRVFAALQPFTRVIRRRPPLSPL